MFGCMTKQCQYCLHSLVIIKILQRPLYYNVTDIQSKHNKIIKILVVCLYRFIVMTMIQQGVEAEGVELQPAWEKCNYYTIVWKPQKFYWTKTFIIKPR